jgi:phosphatidate phosphatase
MTYSNGVEKKNVIILIIFIIIDILLIISIFVPPGVFYLSFKPFKRGFFCDDESISHPYKDDTVTIGTVIIIGLLLPIAGIMICEIIYFAQLRKKSWKEAEIWPKYLGNKKLPSIINNILIGFGNFFAGLAVTLAFTEMGKIMVGRLRPHFLDACQPDWSLINCTIVQSNGFIKSRYVDDDNICRPTNEKKYWDSRKSFPSGHSSVAVYCMLFLALYIQFRIHWRKLYFLKLVIQVGLLLLAVACVLSRISDYKHHWSDVLAGSIIGIIVAFYDIFVIWKLPKKYNLLEKKIKNANENNESSRRLSDNLQTTHDLDLKVINRSSPGRMDENVA